MKPPSSQGAPDRPDPRDRRDAPEVMARYHAELDLVDLTAKQLARRMSGASATIDDLRSFGHEGLLLAARTFDEARGVPFRRWANLRIRGAMIDGVRQFGSLPRRIYRELGAMADADRVLEAYDEEDAASPAGSPEAADARLTSYLGGLATAMAMGTMGEATAAAGGEAASERGSPEELASLSELVGHVRSIVARLPDAERTLVERHYFADETLDQAAAALGLSKSWGSRLHARAIDAIARELKKLG
jgi:RNA polymerase sigma factor for flagellar operon FliA